MHFVRVESRPQQQQSNGDIVNKAEKINTAGEQVDDANSVSRGRSFTLLSALSHTRDTDHPR